ncbi:Lin0512 family protein [Anaerotignum sp.]|uniref:Lin0512 family protein n=1 Tax=Anaerotignum sp. TaxID=2039241 RepID=UPI00271503D5|nr:Lin0512 family protein [Anaerotignum sp.]
MGRYIIEFGIGTDFHGQDAGKAAVKAVRDAVSRSCLCGLTEVLGLEDLDKSVKIKVTVAMSSPEKADSEEIVKCLPIGEVEVKAVKGGLQVPGLYIPRFGDKDESIEAAIAAVEVWILEP